MSSERRPRGAGPGAGLDVFERGGDTSIGEPSYSRTADAIRRDIIDGHFRDGARLVTMELAERYGLSLAPIREALHQLSAEGIVVIQPKRGAVVRGITVAFLDEIYEVRLGLIPYLEGERAALASPEDVALMERIQAAYEAAVAVGSHGDAIKLNIEFHGAALAVRPNREALQILKRHHTLIKAMRVRYGFGPQRLETVVEEHRQILDAYRRRSAEAAMAVSRTHLRNAYQELIELFRTGPR